MYHVTIMFHWGITSQRETALRGPHLHVQPSSTLICNGWSIGFGMKAGLLIQSLSSLFQYSQSCCRNTWSKWLLAISMSIIAFRVEAVYLLQVTLLHSWLKFWSLKINLEPPSPSPSLCSFQAKSLILFGGKFWSQQITYKKWMCCWKYVWPYFREAVIIQVFPSPSGDCVTWEQWCQTLPAWCPHRPFVAWGRSSHAAGNDSVGEGALMEPDSFVFGASKVPSVALRPHQHPLPPWSLWPFRRDKSCPATS